MNIYKRLLCLTVAFLLFTQMCYGASMEELQELSEEMRIFEVIVGITQMDHMFPADDEDILRNALAEIFINDPEKLEDALVGAMKAFDPNTRYIRAADYQQTMQSVTGNYVGIGISISMENSKAYISTPFPNSPAEEAGVLGGDIIIAVDGENVTAADTNSIVQLIRGEAGTKVVLTVNRRGTLLDITLERREIKMNPVSYRVVEGDIGYLQLTTFNSNVQEYMEAALEDLKSQGVKRIIFDLRDNFGGEVTGALAAASFFIPGKKLIMTQTFKDTSRNVTFSSTSDTVDFKVCVLINENSASASEIVAGAIADHKIGPLVGETSYGKGTVQYVRQILTGGAVWYTAAAYLTPSGEWIHGKGITPDYVIENTPEELDTSHLPKLISNRVMQLGDTGADVAALKQNLAAIGFSHLKTDDIFDDPTFESIKNLQAYEELYPYGVADINTQLAIRRLVSEATYTPDKQFEKALELARNL